MRACAAHAARRASERSIVVGDLNVAPLEHDVWSHKQLLKVVSHTPIECEKLTAAQKAGNWIDVRAHVRAASRRSSTPGGAIARRTGRAADKGRRLDHIWVSPALGDRRRSDQGRQGCARLGAAVGPRAGDGDAGRLATQPRRGRSCIEHARARRRISGDRIARARAAICSRSMLRRVRIAFEHLQEQAARNADHRRRLARRSRSPGASVSVSSASSPSSVPGPATTSPTDFGAAVRSRNDPSCTT